MSVEWMWKKAQLSPLSSLFLYGYSLKFFVKFVLVALWWKNALSVLNTWKANKKACFFQSMFTRF